MSAVAIAPPSPPTRLMTADEFWDFVHLPENEDRDFELIRGKVVEMSRPTLPHGRVCTNVGFELETWARRLGRGYVVSNDAGVSLEENPDSVLGPDVAYFSNGESFDELSPKWAESAPVLAVEVLSPNDRPGKINQKIAAYLRGGTKLVWLVDYEERTVTVYHPDRNFEIYKAGDELTCSEDLPGFTCRVADLFRLPGQPQPATS